MKKASIILVGLALLAGCEFKGAITQPGSQPSASPSSSASTAPRPTNNDAPQVKVANVNPRVIGSASDRMTFTIEASSPLGDSLEYTWSSTKGFMSATRGETVFWIPTDGSGKPETGPAVITCVITDTHNNQKKVDFNILILPSGGAEMKQQTES